MLHTPFISPSLINHPKNFVQESNHSTVTYPLFGLKTSLSTLSQNTINPSSPTITTSPIINYIPALTHGRYIKRSDVLDSNIHRQPVFISIIHTHATVKVLLCYKLAYSVSHPT